jgi:hypothetical protein
MPYVEMGTCRARAVFGVLGMVAGVVYYFKSDAQGTHGMAYEKGP